MSLEDKETGGAALGHEVDAEVMRSELKGDVLEMLRTQRTRRPYTFDCG
jgi:hypothetical protein